MKLSPGLLIVGFVLTLCWDCPAVHGEAPVVDVIEIDNQIITPVVQRYIETAIDRSESGKAVCLVIMLDTPGGLMESTRAIVKRMMNAQVPIVVYVAPSGSRAASAGLFITLAAHVAAMAPSTNIGAAHPVTFGGMGESIERAVKRSGEGETPGESGEGKGETVTERTPTEEKIINDTVAWITAVARTRGRNEKWAARAVTESVSITEKEAVEEHVVDFIAQDLPDLLAKLNGRQVQIKGNTVTLNSAGATVVTIPMTAWQKFLAIITHPQVAYLLMMLGVLGLIFEFTHPGVAFPGIAGVICLLLALYAFQLLPVNYAAIALLILGIVLLIGEVKVVSHGLLALGGAVCLILGSLLLFQSPEPALRLSLGVILPTVVTLMVITLIVLNRAAKSLKYPIATGEQALVGEIGEASTDLDPEGMVFVHGETWRARTGVPVRRGAKIRVLHVEGLHLDVEPQRPENDKKGEV